MKIANAPCSWGVLEFELTYIFGMFQSIGRKNRVGKPIANSESQQENLS